MADQNEEIHENHGNEEAHENHEAHGNREAHENHAPRNGTRQEEQEQEWKNRVLRIVDVILRIPILYLIDFLSNGLFLCVLLKIFGIQSQFFGEFGEFSSNNSGLITIFPKFPKEELEFFDAVFSWDGKCNALWDHTSWFSYFILTIFYLFCIFCALSLLIAETNQLLDCLLYLYPLLLVIISISWRLSDSMTSSDEEFVPDSGNSDRSKTASALFCVMDAAINIIIRGAYGLIAKILYVEGRSRSVIPFRQYLVLIPNIILEMVFLSPMVFTFVSFLIGFQSVTFTLSLTCFTPVLVLEAIVLILHIIPTVLKIIWLAIRVNRQTVKDYGYLHTFLNHWARIRFPILVRSFWITRTALLMVFAIVNWELWEVKDWSDYKTNFIKSVEYLLARGCETWVVVLGMTSVVSSIGHYVGNVFLSFLKRAELNDQHGGVIEDEDERNGGNLLGILFLILAAQTGLTELKPEKRLLKLYRNFWLLSMAMLHFVHQMTDSLLMRISTTGYYRWQAHVRGLTVSAFLLTVPWIYIFLVWSRHDIWNPWLISVALFALEVVVKTLISLLVYGLLILDSCRSGGLKHLDDFVYWTRGFGAFLEFLFAILLLLNGVWILTFEQAGILRSVMIGIHAYCNIWLQAKEGWESFRRRWHAAKRLDQLFSPSSEFLENLKDVCSICYQELTEVGPVKFTPCQHYFHNSCLRKWLYVQDTCPMCHAPILDGPQTNRDIRT